MQWYRSWGELYELLQPGLKRSLERQCILYSLRAQDALYLRRQK